MKEIIEENATMLFLRLKGVTILQDSSVGDR